MGLTLFIILYKYELEIIRDVRDIKIITKKVKILVI